MDCFANFDKLNVPIFICSKEWTVLFRNRVCKKYTTSPRTNSSFSRCFIDKVNTVFPKENGDLTLIGCIIHDVYKTSMCLEYKGYAVVMFPSIIEYDMLFSGTYDENTQEIADSFRSVFDIFMNGSFDNIPDKYGYIEKIRRNAYCAIDNYVAFSMFDTEKRSLCSIKRLYEFFYERVLKTAKKAGYRIESDFSQISEFGDVIYTDSMYFSMVLSSLLLLCLSISADKKCVVESEHLGCSVRNRINFTYDKPIKINKSGECLTEFINMDPVEYLNFIPFEELCRSLNWDLKYEISSEKELNVSVWFDIEIDNKIVFNSPGKTKELSPEKLIMYIISNFFDIAIR